MYERMFGDAMHADRLRQSLGKMPLMEVERARRLQRRASTQRWCRHAVAKALIGLATRIAPTVTASTPEPRAIAR